MLMAENSLLDNDMFDAFATASDNVYVYVCDMKNNLSRWSKRAVDYFNMPSEYMQDAGAIWTERIHHDDRQIYLNDINAVFSGKSDKHCCEYRALNKNGEYVWVECRGTMTHDENGEPKLFAGMMTRLDARNKYDPVTGLKTIYEFNKYDFSLESGSVILIGLDDFGEVINNYGYGFGDRILFEVGRMFQEYCGNTRYIYRMEGDKFLIISPNSTSDDTKKMFYTLKQMAAELGNNGNLPVHLGMSGGAVFYPEDGRKRDQIIANVEYSLSQAKQNSRGKLVIYSPEVAKNLNFTIKKRQIILHSVQNGLDGFDVYFQPIVDAKDYKVTGCEALLRWFNSEVGNVNIEKLVKYLEYTGEINRVGFWVMDNVFRKAKEWQDKYGDIEVGFNVSYVQFKDPGFVDEIIAMGRKYDVNPGLINIELTESSKVDDFATLIHIFERLRGEGYKISLDDFGIAYSTLLLLRNLPVDFVKVDNSFVRNLSEENKVDLAIVESVISLCDRLNIGVVVEGVENREILDILDRNPVSRLQGYYFSKPMPVGDFVKVIHKTY